MGCKQSRGTAKASKRVDTAACQEASGSPSSREEVLAFQHENQEYLAVMGFLAHVPLFKRLPKDQHPLLASACESRCFEAGETIMRQGSLGSDFFVIRSGEARVLQTPEDDPTAEPLEVAMLREGDYFGEDALLKDAPRAATIIATQALGALRISREQFKELKLDQKLLFASRRKAVGFGGDGAGVTTRLPTKKSAGERVLISDAFRKNKNLAAIGCLDDARIKLMVDTAWLESIPAGTEVMKQGDANANYFYIIQDGSFEIDVTVGRRSTSNMNRMPMSVEESIRLYGLSSVPSSPSKHSRTLGQGDSFGELALLYSLPRSATVTALVKSSLWVIDRNQFQKILRAVSEEKFAEHVRYLDNVPLLKILSKLEKRAIAKAMMDVHFKKDDVVIRQGEPGNTFYVLYDGEVSVSIDGTEKVRLIASVDRNEAHYFGERALLRQEPRSATVTVISDTANGMALDKESFTALLGPLEDIFQRRAKIPATCLACWKVCHFSKEPEEHSKLLRSRSSLLSVGGNDMRSTTHSTASKDFCRDWHIKQKDLRQVGVLGCGGFGLVELYEHETTGDTYALKTMSKGYIVERDMQESVVTEKFVLSMTNSPFIIKLYETYSSPENVAFLMEAALGGELHVIYHRQALYGEEQHAMYYSGGVILALEHLHERRVIYRDLKPENLLLNKEGHLKVTDMGLSKFVIGKTYTTCGTPDYFAPEVVSSTGHTCAVDWWTLGILLFEMMTAHPPFEDDSHMKIFSRVMNGIEEVKFPVYVPGPMEEMIKAILQKEPSHRLPMRPGGVKNLKAHKWFKGFNWFELETLTMEPPYLPSVTSDTDLQHFSPDLRDMPKNVPYVDDGSGWDQDFATSE